jgi:uncharacterized membrane protein YqiK
MATISVGGHLDTVALEGLVLGLLKSLKLDKNGDGKVTKAEAFQSLSELAPQFFNISDVVAETRDLDSSEFQHLCNVAAMNMPDYPNLRAEAETVVSNALELVGSGAKLIAAITRLNATKPVPVVPAAPTNPVKPQAPVGAATANPASKQ